MSRSYDLVSDEVNYVDLGASARAGHFPPQFGGHAFLLHPPLFFYLTALWEILAGTGGTYVHEVADVRTLNALFGIASALVVFGIGRRSVSRSAGLAAGLLFALDAYVLRQNARALLDTLAVLVLLVGYRSLLPLLRPSTPARLEVTAADRRRAVVAGSVLGLSILVKDMAAILVFVPLGFAWWRRWSPGREQLKRVMAWALPPYLLYVVALTVTGHLSDFISQEKQGLWRMLGLVKSTGFTRQGSPSLVQTLAHQMGTFAVTYLACGLGLFAAVYILRVSSRDDQKVMALVTVGGALTVAYAGAFGTIEEQFLYYMMVPAIISIASAAVIAIGSLPAPRSKVQWTRIAVTLLLLAVAYDTVQWIQIRTSPDNGVQRVVAFFDNQPVDPGVVGCDTDAAVFALQRSGYDAIGVPSPAQAQHLHIKYVTIFSTTVDGNYGYLDPAQAAYYEKYGRLVYSFHERTYGDVQIYETTNTTVW